MSKFTTLCGLFIFFATSFSFSPVVYGSESVYISEINYNGSSVNGGDKWVELSNPTNTPINLDGWKLSMPNSSKTGTVNLSGVIDSQKAFVIGAKNSKFANVYSNANITSYNITNISNMQAGDLNYINIQLLSSSGSIISQIQKKGDYIKSLGISGKGDIKRSIECDPQAICKLTNQLYGDTGLDFGTPGLFPLQLSKPIPEELISDYKVVQNLKPVDTQVTSALPEPVLEPISTTITAKEVNVNSLEVPSSNPKKTISSLPVVNTSQSAIETTSQTQTAVIQTPSLSIKIVDKPSFRFTSIPDFKFQSFSQQNIPTVYTIDTVPYAQLLVFSLTSLSSVISKTKYKISKLIKA